MFNNLGLSSFFIRTRQKLVMAVDVYSQLLQKIQDTMAILNEMEHIESTNVLFPASEEPVPLQATSELDNTTCHICNGYYGPCFEDPLCSVCHAFLFPNMQVEVLPVTELAECSDDSDSGNDEPADSTDRSSTLSDQRSEHSLIMSDVRRCEDRLTINSSSEYPLGPPSNNELRDAPRVEVEDLNRQISRLYTLQYEVNVYIEYLPPEVLLHVFKYLDEISLWSVGQVCRRWEEILHMHVRPERWRGFTLLRWPLLHFSYDEQDWYQAYTSIIKSCWCIKCIRQMAAQAQATPGTEETSWRKYRLRSEVKAMRLDPLEGISAKPLDVHCCHWQATIQGPIGSPYEGGLFLLYIQVPYSYPMCPPIVRFLTKIFHPNVSRHGDIGIDSIHHNWSLALTISKILISIQSLLTDPYCDICMEPEIGKLYLTDKKRFEEQARLWTWIYAMHDLRTHRNRL